MLSDTHPVDQGGAVPVIDVGPLSSGADVAPVAAAIDRACREHGFFSIVGHGVAPDLLARMDAAARRFFALADGQKGALSMDRGGPAWRGWFPLGGELTSGHPDRKEGIYFGAELGADDPRVRAGVPLHGPNLFPEHPSDLRTSVLAYLDALTALGHVLMGGIAMGLGLERDWFARNLTADPLVLFRIFHYPPEPTGAVGGPWGVAEHTDYGLLTILAQDDAGGLQVRSPRGWIDVVPVPGAFVCNIGDMLERMTGGRYRSTPHRVRNTSGESRLSFPFFFDPGWDAEVRPVPVAAEGGAGVDRDAPPRWDGEDVGGWAGTYGDHLRTRLSRVFPDLAAGALERP